MLRRPRAVASRATARIARPVALTLALLLPGIAGAPAPARAITVPPTTATGTLPFVDTFEAGTGNWTSVTDGSGRIRSITGATGRALRLSVPRGSGNRAYLRYDITAGTSGLYARALVRVRSAVCDSSAGWSYGNVPFLRFFDTEGNRVVGVYAIKRPCTSGSSTVGTAHQIWVQHSYGNYYPTRGRITVGASAWTRVEFQATVTTPGRSNVSVWVNGTLVYSTNLASNGRLALASVVIGNEHLGQAAVLDVDSVRLRTVPVLPAAPDPCTGGDGTTGASMVGGTVVRSDTFEDYSLAGWAVTLGDSGTAVISSRRAQSPTCGLRLIATSELRSRAILSTGLPSGTVDASAEGWFLVERASATNVPYLRLFGSARAVDVYRQTSTGHLWLAVGRPGTTAYRRYDLGVVAALGSWHQVAVHANASTGRVEVRVDGTLRRSGRWSLGTSTLRRVQVGNEITRQPSILWVDDLVVTRGG